MSVSLAFAAFAFAAVGTDGDAACLAGPNTNQLLLVPAKETRFSSETRAFSPGHSDHNTTTFQKQANFQETTLRTKNTKQNKNQAAIVHGYTHTYIP